MGFEFLSLTVEVQIREHLVFTYLRNLALDIYSSPLQHRQALNFETGPREDKVNSENQPALDFGLHIPLLTIRESVQAKVKTQEKMHPVILKFLSILSKNTTYRDGKIFTVS